MVQDTGQWFVMDAVRGIFAEIDKLLYYLISWLYEIFFNVANAQLLSGDVIKDLFSRVQLILGIIIMFKIAMSLFNGIMNPDSLRNDKTGFSSMIKRVILALIMLILLVPLNIPTSDLSSTTDGSSSQGTWNKRMNDNGILFGTLYELQSRILSQNTVARLILGIDTDDDLVLNDTYKDTANELATIVLRCFVTINLSEEPTDYNPDPLLMCPDDKWDSYYEKYDDSNATVSDILGDINEWCYRSNSNLNDGKDHYIFNYKFLLSTAAAILFGIILISFTVDVVIRLFKLALLQLIAPIPILSYIDPKSQNTFQTWTKTVGLTYASLFLRLAIMYFIIFLMREFGQGDLLDTTVGGRGAVWLFSKFFIYLGLVMFAKAAPKFILDSLGIKSEGGFFSGLGRLHGAGSMLAGTVGSAATNWRAFREEHKKNTAGGFKAGASNFFRRGVGAAGSALVGGASGFFTGANALSGADKDFNANVMKAMQARNAQRAAHSTALGRFADRQSQLWTGMSLADRDSAALEAAKNAATQLKNVKTMKEEEAIKHGKYGTLENMIKDSNGNVISKLSLNYADLEAHLKNPDSNGKIKIHDYNSGGEVILNASDFNANVLSKLKDSQATKYENGLTIAGGTNFVDNGKLQTAITELTAAINKTDLAKGHSVNDVIAYDQLGKTIGEANKLVASMNTEMKHIKHMANKQSNNNK